MNGRIYNPNLHRMLSPDPVTQTPENAQNYNRYSYAFNNSLRYIDLSGYIAEATTTAGAVADYVADFAANTMLNKVCS